MPWVPGLSVRVLTHEGARASSGHQLVTDALLGLVRRHHLAGATVVRAVEGVSDHGPVRAAGLVDLGADLPLVIEIVDRADRIEPLLQEIAALVPSGVLSVAAARVYFPATDLRVADVMAKPRAGAVVRPETPLAEVLAPLLEGAVRMVVVATAEGRLAGIITLGQLLRTVDPALASHIAERHQQDPGHLRQHLEQATAGRTAWDVMLAEPVVVRSDMPLEAAARTLTARGVTRAPVVDAASTVVGVLGERQLAAALVAPTIASGDGEEAEVLRLCVLPGAGETVTAGVLAQRDLPVLPETLNGTATVRSVYETHARLALVVGPDGRLRGIVDEHALLDHTLPAASGGARAALARLFSRAPDRALAAVREREREPQQRGGTTSSSSTTAASLMRPAPAVVAAETPVAQALAEQLHATDCDVAVVIDAAERPVGVLWRNEALRVLVGG